MTLPARRASMLCVLLAAGLVRPGVAVAQKRSAPVQGAKPLAESLSAEAAQAYGYAHTLFRNGDYVGALAKYREAYDLSKDPRLLFNMALCARSVHAYARTQRLLLQYIREAGPTFSPSDRAEADGALAAVRGLVGTMTLTVNEAGATVSVDGEEVGTTPLAGPIAVDLGAHKVAVTKAGFDPVEKPVEVAGGASAALSMTLLARAQGGARLAVNTEAAATVVLDGRVVGAGHYEGALAPGVHALRVTATGKKPYSAGVEVHEGEARTVDVTLDPEAQGGRVWLWVTGGVALAAGLAVGGYFALRPQDQQTAAPQAPATAGKYQLAAWGR